MSSPLYNTTILNGTLVQHESRSITESSWRLDLAVGPEDKFFTSYMLVKLSENVRAQGLPEEGEFRGTVTGVRQKKDGKFVKDFNVIQKSVPYTVPKEYAPVMEEGEPLHKDSQIILGRPFTEEEIQQGFDLAKLVGKTCVVIITIKKGTGGKSKATVHGVKPDVQAPETAN